MVVRGTYQLDGALTRPAPAGAGANGPVDRRLMASLTAGLVGKSAEMGTLLLLAVVVPRMLGPRDYGRFAVALTVVTIGSLALTLGGPTLMARYVPEAAPDERIGLARALGFRLARGRAVQLAAVALVALVLVAAAPARFPPLLTAAVFGALALNVAATLLLQVGLGLGRTGAWSARYPLQNAALIALVLVLHPAAGATGAVCAILAASVVALVFAGVATAPVLVGETAVAARIPHGALRFGTLNAAGAALVQLTHRGGVLAVALLAGSTSETGYAALAIGIALGATYAVLQAFTVALPHLADGASGGTEAAEAVLRRIAATMLAVLLPATVLVALTLRGLVPALFGSEFTGAVAASGPALGMVVLAPLNAVAVQVAALRLRPRVALAGGLASAAVFVIVAALAVPAWGAAGGTTAGMAGVAAGAVVSVRMLPGALGARIGLASFAGAAAVAMLGSLA